MSKGQGFSLLLRKIDMLKLSVRKICELCVKLHVVFLCLFYNLEQNLNIAKVILSLPLNTFF